MIQSPDDRSALAKAISWAYLAMGVAMEMVVPGLVGYWVDQRLGTEPLLVLLGFAGGVTLAIWHLIRATQKPRSESGGKEPPAGRQL